MKTSFHFPFSFDPFHGGLSHASGICRCREGGIHCEYRVDVCGIGWKGKVHTSFLAYSEITRCEFWSSWFDGGPQIFTPVAKCRLAVEGERFRRPGDIHARFMNCLLKWRRVMGASRGRGR